MNVQNHNNAHISLALGLGKYKYRKNFEFETKLGILLLSVKERGFFLKNENGNFNLVFDMNEVLAFDNPLVWRYDRD